MSAPSARTVVFDVIGTSFSLDRPRQALVSLGAPGDLLELWFSRSLRDFFAFSHAGGYAPMQDVLRADLGRSLRQLGLSPSATDLEKVVGTFSELDPRPDLAQAVRVLSDAGCRLVALTNGGAGATQRLLDRARLLNDFAEVLSCDSIRITKPNRAVYDLALRRAGGESWMVAAHAWDIAGAAAAGMRTAFVTSVEGSYMEIFPEPDLIVGSLLEAARTIVGRKSGPLDEGGGPG